MVRTGLPAGHAARCSEGSRKTVRQVGARVGRSLSAGRNPQETKTAGVAWVLRPDGNRTHRDGSPGTRILAWSVGGQLPARQTPFGTTIAPDGRMAGASLTPRHREFLDLVLRHSGVFVGRQYAAFANITHGQKVHDFIGRVLAHGYARPIALGPNGRTRLFHVHYKPLYRAIGETDNRHRRRPTIEQALERLLVLDGVLMDRSLTWLATEREKRAHFGAAGPRPARQRVSAAGLRTGAAADRPLLPGQAAHRARRVRPHPRVPLPGAQHQSRPLLPVPRAPSLVPELAAVLDRQGADEAADAPRAELSVGGTDDAGVAASPGRAAPSCCGSSR